MRVILLWIILSPPAQWFASAGAALRKRQIDAIWPSDVGAKSKLD